MEKKQHNYPLPRHVNHQYPNCLLNVLYFHQNLRLTISYASFYDSDKNESGVVDTIVDGKYSVKYFSDVVLLKKMLHSRSFEPKSTASKTQKHHQKFISAFGRIF